MGKKRYVVTAEYIMSETHDIAGNRVMLGWYRGSLLPEDTTEESIEHHLSTRQIKEVKVDTDADGNVSITDHEDLRQTDPAEAKVVDGLGEPNTNGPALEPVADSNEVKAGDQVPEPNKRTGERADWVDYAVSKGADRKDIEDKKVTKADLIATWGTPK
jgi:hypothetical protein